MKYRVITRHGLAHLQSRRPFLRVLRRWVTIAIGSERVLRAPAADLETHCQPRP